MKGPGGSQLASLAFVAMLSSGACGGPSQEAYTGDGVESCVECAPSVRRQVVLGGRGPGVGRLGSIEPVGRDLFYINHVDVTAEIGVHHRSGRYVGTIGRAGAGPGEFRNIASILVAGDSLRAVDSRLARQTVMSLSGQVGRTMPLTVGILRAWLLPAGELLVHRRCPTYMLECDANPVLIFDDSTQRVSFGGSPSERDEAVQWTAGAVDEGGFWAARRGSYALYRWSLEGELTDSIVRSVSWFPPHDITPFRAGIRPGPRIRDVRVDGSGRMWILINVADDRWMEPFRETGDPDTRFTGDYERYFDTVLEVIDLQSRRVIATARYDEYISRITSDFRLVAERETDHGEPYLEVWAVRLPTPSYLTPSFSGTP